MPATDQCEPAVVNALAKDGWVVIDRPFTIQLDKAKRSYIYADLRLRNQTDNRTVIIIEVKCFSGNESLFNEFYGAIGQYATYRDALELLHISAPLFLAIPSDIYATFFQTPIIQSVLTTLRIQLIIINIQLEEIVEWI